MLVRKNYLRNMETGYNINGMVNYRTTLRLPVNYKKLRTLRDRCGATQAEVSEACGIKQGHYTQFECGRINPSLPTLERLAQYYKVSVSDLLTARSHAELSGVANRLAAILGAQLVFNQKESKPATA